MKWLYTVMIGALALPLSMAWGQGTAFDVIAALPGDDMIPDDAQFPGAGRRGGTMDGMPPGLIERLKLTDEQQAALKTLRFAFAKDMARLRAEVEVARIELREVMDGTAPQTSEARAKAKKVSEAGAKLFERTVVFRVDMKNMLTPEQQKTLQETGRRMLRARRFGMRHGRRGGRPFFGPRFGPRMERRDGPRLETPPSPEP